VSENQIEREAGHSLTPHRVGRTKNKKKKKNKSRKHKRRPFYTRKNQRGCEESSFGATKKGNDPAKKMKKAARRGKGGHLRNVCDHCHWRGCIPCRIQPESEKKKKELVSGRLVGSGEVNINQRGESLKCYIKKRMEQRVLYSGRRGSLLCSLTGKNAH